jgi:hypothetical protein
MNVKLIGRTEPPRLSLSAVVCPNCNQVSCALLPSKACNRILTCVSPARSVLLSLQYDIIKRMERMGKSVGMIAGQAEPTIIQPSQYRKRFSLAMERYFMTIPDKWITHET